MTHESPSRRQALKTAAAGFGYLALAGIPPFDGFWSKDEVLQAAWHMSPGLWVVGTVTAGLTAYYMSRQVALVWAGQPRWSEDDQVATAAVGSHGSGGTGEQATAGDPTGHGGHGGPEGHDGHDGHGREPHEAPWVMAVSLVMVNSS